MKTKFKLITGTSYEEVSEVLWALSCKYELAREPIDVSDHNLIMVAVFYR